MLAVGEDHHVRAGDEKNNHGFSVGQTIKRNFLRFVF